MKKLQEEKLLIEKLLAKDESTFFYFYQKYYPYLFHFISRQIADKSVIEELIQDVFIDFFEALRDFRYRCQIRTYLLTIARNKVIDWIRKKRLKQMVFSVLPSRLVEGLAIVILDDNLEKEELARKISQTLTILPANYRLVLQLKYWEGRSVQQIAQKLSLQFKATESLLFRARRAFAKSFRSQL